MTRRVLHWLIAAVIALGLLAIPATSAQAAPGPSDAPQWWFDAWNVPALWAGGARGQGITIAEVDTGVNAALPELAANVIPGKDYGDPSLDGRTDHETAAFGHGTAMASLMVAQPGTAGITGLAPAAKVLPIAVPLSGTDDQKASAGDPIDDAIRYAADHGAKIISLSLGGSRVPPVDPCPQPEQDAITYAIGKGAVLVAASGNSGPNNPSVEDPAVCLGVVSVGAVDSNDQVAAFSSRHPFLTVTAPGVNIPTLSRVAGQAYRGDGTSQATAITSAAIALIWSKYPTLTGRQIVARLLATLDHASSTRDPAYGFGIINPEKAINTAVPLTAANPVFAALDPFVAHENAFAAPLTPRVPAPAATQPLPSVTALVAPAPGNITTRVMVGVLVAIAGVAAFLLLGAVGLWRRLRRPRYREPVAPIPYAALAYPAAPVGRNGRPEPAQSRDDTGVVWHDVTDIVPASPFNRGKVIRS